MQPNRAQEPLPARSSAITFLVLGGYTLLIQVVLVRECFSLFAGNELSLAVQLLLWLCFTAAGGALGTLLPARAAAPLLLLLSPAGVVAVVLVRTLPLVLPVPVGAEVPFPWAVLSLALAQAPLNLVAGSLFATACRRFGGRKEGEAIGRFYAVETLGAAAAGAGFTFLLAGRVAGVEAGVGAAAVVAVAAAVTLWPIARRLRAAAVCVAVALAAFAVLGDPAGMIDALWWRVRQPGSEHVASVETRYQRIDVGVRDGQHTVYCNGVPGVALEGGDEPLDGRRLADLYLSLHPDPKRVLIIGAGEPGLLARALEHPLEHLVYVLLDRATLDLARSLGEGPAWDDPRLSIAATDGRAYLRATEDRFDVILLDLPAPHTAAGNRFFTRQAFEASRARLREGGLLILHLPSSALHLPAESRRLLASVHRALSGAFGRTELIAGDRMIFVGGLAGPVPALEVLADRFARGGPPIELASGGTVSDPDTKRAVFAALYESQFDPFRRQRQEEELLTADAAANDDRRPVAYVLNLRRWLREMGADGRTVESAFHAAEAAVAFLRNHRLLAVLGAVALGLAPVVVFAGRRRTACFVPRHALAVAVLASGWAGMVGELALVFMYQNAFGQVYHAVGGLLAAYMTGLTAGSATATRLSRTPKGRVAWLLGCRGLMIGSCAAAVVLTESEQAAAFFVVVLGYAFVLGMEFPLASRIYRDDARGPRAAGVVHAMDHLGAALAAALGGTVLLPLAGPRATLFAVGCVHAVVLAALAGFVLLRPAARLRPTSPALDRPKGQG